MTVVATAITIALMAGAVYIAILSGVRLQRSFARAQRTWRARKNARGQR